MRSLRTNNYMQLLSVPLLTAELQRKLQHSRPSHIFQRMVSTGRVAQSVEQSRGIR